MNCSEVQERLSAYYDGQLPEGVAADVATHLSSCPSCAEELASFGRLSDISRRLDEPQAPAHLWDQLVARLGTTEEHLPTVAPFHQQRFSGRLLAIAATVAVVAGVGILAYTNWLTQPAHDQLAVNFAEYLHRFNEQPEDAQRVFLAKYEGRSTTFQEATATLGYEPLAAKGPPPGYSVEDVYLLNMPCCTCAQVVCKNEEGQSIAVFEHDVEQPVWFGDRPTVDCLCHGIATSVVEVGGQLAATWKEGTRFITIIGARDLNEVTDFVAHFSGSNSSSS